MSMLGRIAWCAALLSCANAAVAQEDDSGWFEDEAVEEQSADEPAEPEPVKAPEARKAEVESATTAPSQRRENDNEDDYEHEHEHEHERGWKRRGAREIALIGGKMRLEAPELVRSLESAGFSDPTELRFVGIQGTRVVGKRFVAGLGGSIGWSDAFERDDGAKGRLRLMQLRANLGFALVHTPKWLLYPAFELGLNHVEIDIGAPGRTSFDQALAEPRTGSELTRTSVSAGGVIAVERRFTFRRRSRGDWTRYFAIGLRGSWSRDFSASPWRVDGDGEIMGPEERHTIKYIGLTLGFGHARF